MIAHHHSSQFHSGLLQVWVKPNAKDLWQVYRPPKYTVGSTNRASEIFGGKIPLPSSTSLHSVVVGGTYKTATLPPVEMAWPHKEAVRPLKILTEQLWQAQQQQEEEEGNCWVLPQQAAAAAS